MADVNPVIMAKARAILSEKVSFQFCSRSPIFEVAASFYALKGRLEIQADSKEYWNMASKKLTVKKTAGVQMSKPPKAYQDFVSRFPGLAKAWDATSDAGTKGPFDEKQIRLIKLAIAVGAMREGAIRSSVRKAVAIGVTQKELDQVVSLAAGTLGFPSTVAVFSWMESAQKRL